MELFDVEVKSHDRESAILNKLKEKAKWRRDSNVTSSRTDSAFARGVVDVLEDRIPKQSRKRSSILRDLLI